MIRGADKTAAVFPLYGFASKNGLVYRYSSDRVTEINFRLLRADRGKEHIHNPSYLSDKYAAKVSPVWDLKNRRVASLGEIEGNEGAEDRE